MRADEVRAKQAAEDAEAAPGMEEEGEGTQRKRRKGPPGPRPRIPLNFTVETLSADAFSETTSPLFVGTSDGRMLLLKIALEKGKPSCTLMHDVSVMQGPDADRAPVAVMAVRDRVVAAVSSKSGTSLNVYNYSASPRKPPGLVHYVPLDVGGQQLLQVKVFPPYPPPPNAQFLILVHFFAAKKSVFVLPCLGRNCAGVMAVGWRHWAWSCDDSCVENGMAVSLGSVAHS